MGKALKNSAPGKVAYIWRIKRFPIDTIKFERTQIPFFSDVFTAVVVVVAKGPKYLQQQALVRNVIIIIIFGQCLFVWCDTYDLFCEF